MQEDMEREGDRADDVAPSSVAAVAASKASRTGFASTAPTKKPPLSLASTSAPSAMNPIRNDGELAQIKAAEKKTSASNRWTRKFARERDVPLELVDSSDDECPEAGADRDFYIRLKRVARDEYRKHPNLHPPDHLIAATVGAQPNNVVTALPRIGQIDSILPKIASMTSIVLVGVPVDVGLDSRENYPKNRIILSIGPALVRKMMHQEERILYSNTYHVEHKHTTATYLVPSGFSTVEDIELGYLKDFDTRHIEAAVGRCVVVAEDKRLSRALTTREAHRALLISYDKEKQKAKLRLLASGSLVYCNPWRLRRFTVPAFKLKTSLIVAKLYGCRSYDTEKMTNVLRYLERPGQSTLLWMRTAPRRADLNTFNVKDQPAVLLEVDVFMVGYRIWLSTYALGRGFATPDQDTRRFYEMHSALERPSVDDMVAFYRDVAQGQNWHKTLYENVPVN